MTTDLADRLNRYRIIRTSGIGPAAAAAEAGIGPNDVAALAETATLALSTQAIIGKDRDRYHEAHRHAHLDGQRLDRARAVAWLHEAGAYSHAAGLARLPLVEHPVPPEIGVLAYAADNAKEPA
jgi:hypothetical protein